MKTNLGIIIGLAILIGISFHQSIRKRPWEYRIEAAPMLLPTDMNRLGDEGWELVYISPTRAGFEAIYKRPK